MIHAKTIQWHDILVRRVLYNLQEKILKVIPKNFIFSAGNEITDVTINGKENIPL